jgi:CHAT domain-containing protein
MIRSAGGYSAVTPDVGDSSDFFDWVDRCSRWARGYAESSQLDATSAAMAVSLLQGIPDWADTLLISPDGPLMGLPWHELPLPPGGPHRTVGERYAIGILPAAGVLRQLRSQESQTPELAYLGVACDGASSVGHRRLECADAEVETIASTYFTPTGAVAFPTEVCHKFFDEQRRVQLLHCSCHAERGGLLLSRTNEWTTPMDLLHLGVQADLLLLTGCNAGDFARDDSNELLGIVRQLLVATRARAAIVSLAKVPDAAGLIFADLIVSALTNQSPSRPWRTPGSALPVGRAVAWARRRMRGLTREELQPLVPSRGPAIEPNHPSWWAPWFVVGDPTVMVSEPGA